MNRVQMLCTAGALVFGVSGCATTTATKEKSAKDSPPSTDHPTQNQNDVDDGALLATDDPAKFSGVVTTTMDSGGYTYVRVVRDDGKAVWTAVGQQSLAVGDRVTVQRSVTMRDFHSKTLERTFERIVFGEVVEHVKGSDTAISPKPANAGEDEREVIEL